MANSIITLRDVSVTYRKRRSFFRHDYYEALRTVSFDVYCGETLGIIGRNGCGKSTLLRLLAGILDPDGGHVDRNGATVSLLSMAVGFDSELSGRDNVILSAILLGASRNEALDNIERIIDFSELGSFIDEPVKTYSSGMRMRLGFSIAVTIKPDVILIDEALGAGDAHFKTKAEAAILAKVKSSQTVVLVSHSSKQVLKLCDRAIWIEQGTVAFQGNTEEAVNRYESSTKESRGVGNVKS